MLNTLLIPIIAAVGVFLLFMLVLNLFGSRTKTGERMKRMLAGSGGEDEVSEESQYFADSLRSEKEPSTFANAVSGLFSWIGMDMQAFHAKNQIRFYQAGIHSPNAPIYYLLFSRVLSIVFVAIAIMIAMQAKADLLDYLAALGIATLGLFGADLWIKNMQDKRKQVLQRSFPDALDLLLACVESGLALDGALLRVCRELGRAHPEITYELNRTRIELSLLNDRAQALNNLAERNGMLAFRTLVTSLLQSEKFGTSLTDTLRVMSEDYRTQRLMRAEEKAARLPALMTIPLIIFLLPALMLIILGPAAISVIAAFHTK